MVKREDSHRESRVINFEFMTHTIVHNRWMHIERHSRRLTWQTSIYSNLNVGCRLTTVRRFFDCPVNAGNQSQKRRESCSYSSSNYILLFNLRIWVRELPTNSCKPSQSRPRTTNSSSELTRDGRMLPMRCKPPAASDAARRAPRVPFIPTPWPLPPFYRYAASAGSPALSSLRDSLVVAPCIVCLSLSVVMNEWVSEIETERETLR